MIFADQDFYDECLKDFDPTALAMAYGQRPKFVKAKHSATAEGENCAYGPTMVALQRPGQVQCLGGLTLLKKWRLLVDSEFLWIFFSKFITIKKVFSKIHQKCSLEFTHNMSTEMHPK